MLHSTSEAEPSWVRKGSWQARSSVTGLGGPARSWPRQHFSLHLRQGSDEKGLESMAFMASHTSAGRLQIGELKRDTRTPFLSFFLFFFKHHTQKFHLWNVFWHRKQDLWTRLHGAGGEILTPILTPILFPCFLSYVRTSKWLFWVTVYTSRSWYA